MEHLNKEPVSSRFSGTIARSGELLTSAQRNIDLGSSHYRICVSILNIGEYSTCLVMPYYLRLFDIEGKERVVSDD